MVSVFIFTQPQFISGPKRFAFFLSLFTAAYTCLLACWGAATNDLNNQIYFIRWAGRPIWNGNRKWMCFLHF